MRHQKELQKLKLLLNGEYQADQLTDVQIILSLLAFKIELETSPLLPFRSRPTGCLTSDILSIDSVFLHRSRVSGPGRLQPIALHNLSVRFIDYWYRLLEAAIQIGWANACSRPTAVLRTRVLHWQLSRESGGS